MKRRQIQFHTSITLSARVMFIAPAEASSIIIIQIHIECPLLDWKNYPQHKHHSSRIFGCEKSVERCGLTRQTTSIKIESPVRRVHMHMCMARHLGNTTTNTFVAALLIVLPYTGLISSNSYFCIRILESLKCLFLTDICHVRPRTLDYLHA